MNHHHNAISELIHFIEVKLVFALVPIFFCFLESEAEEAEEAEVFLEVEEAEVFWESEEAEVFLEAEGFLEVEEAEVFLVS